MAASSKLVLVVVALLLGVSVLFYGVMFNGEDALVVDPSSSSAATDGEDGAASDDDAPAASRPAPRSLAAGAKPAESRTDAPRTRPSLGGAGARTGRPSLGGAAARPALSPSPKPAESAAAAAATPAPNDSGPGQIEMGAGRGALAGGTTIPNATTGTAAPATRRRPSLGAGPVARPEERANPVGTPSSAEGASSRKRPSTAAPSTAPRTPRKDPAEILDTTYVIRSGDTLTGIATARLGASRHWRMIVEKNPGLDPSRLRVGQRIVLPARTAVAAAERRRQAAENPAVPTPSTRTGEQVHTVVAGDSLSSIARKYLGADRHWRLIADRNRDILGGDANRLAVGMKLRIPRRPAGG